MSPDQPAAVPLPAHPGYTRSNSDSSLKRLWEGVPANMHRLLVVFIALKKKMIQFRNREPVFSLNPISLSSKRAVFNF